MTVISPNSKVLHGLAWNWITAIGKTQSTFTSMILNDNKISG